MNSNSHNLEKLYDKLKYLINQETLRQQNTIELIASENFTSQEILNISGSILTNKYSEGYPNQRYYGGCQFIDQIETLAIEQACKLFNCKYANVQPYSGSIANFSIYLALVPLGGRILGMDINSGGHLTHGTKISFSGKLYTCESYKVDPITHLIDYDSIRKQALKFKPHLIIAGASNYSRQINFKLFKDIANEVGAYLLLDISHISGLIVTNNHPHCFPHGDVVMTTTHKTLRGPRGAIILWNNEDLTTKINKAVFPGTQGGPLQHIIAAKAQCFIEAQSPSYQEYINNVILNSKTMENTCKELNISTITNGTDNHLLTLNIYKTYGITSNLVQSLLESINITTNKNTIPYEKYSPLTPSGLRIGSPAMTTFGFKSKHFKSTIHFIHEAILNRNNPEKLKEIKHSVQTLINSIKHDK